ncbi:MAG: hypothetical protein WD627_08680 [Actinomycetota bacterium]
MHELPLREHFDNLNGGAAPGPARRSWILKSIGAVVLLIAGVYLVSRIRESAISTRDLVPWGVLARVVVAGAAAYGALQVLLADSWLSLLGSLGATVERREAYRIFGRTQILKYVPGNVFHLAGRHFMSRSLAGHGALGTATVLEAGSLLTAGVVVSIPALAHYGFSVAGNRLWITLILAACLLGAAAIVYFGFLDKRLPRMPSLHPAKLLRAVTLHAAFLLLAGLIFAFAVRSTAQDVQISLPIAVSTYALSWMAGYATPGAPGGIGVREAVIVATLGSRLGTSHALVVSAVFRIVTTLGDVLFFLVSLGLGDRRAPELPSDNPGR